MRIEFQARVPGRRKFRSAHAAAAVLALLAAMFVSGHRLITPGFLLSTNQLNFTGVRVGVETTAQNVDVTNPFNADLVLDSLTLRGEAGAYRFPRNSCVGKTIHPKETCQIGVSFVPAVEGTERATLEVASINGDRRTVELTGLLNLVEAPAAKPEASLPVLRPDGATAIAPDAGTKPVVNTVEEPPPPARITPPKQTPPPAQKSTPPPPPITSTKLPPPLPPAQDSTPPPPSKSQPPPPPPHIQTPPLPPPVIGGSLTPNPVQFAPVTVGSLSVHDVIITNTGDAPFPAGQAEIHGDHWNDFRILTDPCSTRAITSPCAIRLVFLPSEAGQHRAQLLLPSGAKQYSVWLDGMATPPPMPIADLQPQRIDLTQMEPAHPIELRNIGTGNLMVNGISLGGRNPGDFTLETRNCASAVIGRNQGCTMEVIFQADIARRARRKVSDAVVTLQDNAAGSPRIVVVTGTEASTNPKQVVWRPTEPPYIFNPVPPNPRKPAPTPPPGNSNTREPVPPTQKPPQRPPATQEPAPTPTSTTNSNTRQPVPTPTKPPPQKPSVTPQRAPVRPPATKTPTPNIR